MIKQNYHHTIDVYRDVYTGGSTSNQVIITKKPCAIQPYSTSADDPTAFFENQPAFLHYQIFTDELLDIRESDVLVDQDGEKYKVLGIKVYKNKRKHLEIHATSAIRSEFR